MSDGSGELEGGRRRFPGFNAELVWQRQLKASRRVCSRLQPSCWRQGQRYKQPRSGLEPGPEEHDACSGVCKCCWSNANNTTGIQHTHPRVCTDWILDTWTLLYIPLFLFLRLLLVHYTGSIPFHALPCHTHTHNSVALKHRYDIFNMFACEVNRNNKLLNKRVFSRHVADARKAVWLMETRLSDWLACLFKSWLKSLLKSRNETTTHQKNSPGIRSTQKK